MEDKPKISKITLDAINELNKCGIEPTVEEICWLYDLGNETEKIEDLEIRMMIGKRVGDMTLYPLSIGAKIFLATDVQDWFLNDRIMYEAAFIYTLCHSRNPEMFEFKNKNECTKTITKFSRKLKFSTVEFEEAIKDILKENPNEIKKYDQLYSLVTELIDLKRNNKDINLNKIEMWIKEDANKSKNNNSDSSIINIISLLMMYFGKDKNYWLWECSEHECIQMINEALKIESAKNGVSKGKVTVNVNDASSQLLIKLRRTINYIKNEHKALKTIKDIKENKEVKNV